MKSLEQIDILIKDLIDLRAQLVLDIGNMQRACDIKCEVGNSQLVLPEIEERE